MNLYRVAAAKADRRPAFAIQVREQPLAAGRTLRIPGGQLMLQNLDTGESSYSVAVIGGTDAFSGANGLLTTHASAKSTTIEITLK